MPYPDAQPPASCRLDPATIEAIIDGVSNSLRLDLEKLGLAPSGKVEMAERWAGGELVLCPGREGLQEKALPIETFFRKIVLARERLRVLEQKINAHPALDDAARIDMQRYITQIYGSFTTFNVLFAERIDWFIGQKNSH